MQLKKAVFPVAGVGTRPPLKELYAIWSCLIPREHVVQSVEMLEV